MDEVDRGEIHEEKEWHKGITERLAACGFLSESGMAISCHGIKQLRLRPFDDK